MSSSQRTIIRIAAFLLLAVSIYFIIVDGIPTLFSDDFTPDNVSFPSVASYATRHSALPIDSTAVVATDPSSSVGVVSTIPPRPTSAPTEVVQQAPVSTDITAFLQRVNQQRTAQGIPALSYEPDIETVAQMISDDYSTTGQSVQTPSNVDVESALYEENYLYASTWQTSISTRGSLMEFGEDLLADPQAQRFLLEVDFSEIGIGTSTRADGTNNYTIILAEPTILTAPNALRENPGEPTQEAQAQDIVALLNAARASQGLSTLSIDATLNDVALRHSQDQAARNLMTHDGSDGSQIGDRVGRSGYVFSLAGENVLQRPNIHAAAAFDQWWNSPPHYENMMNPAFTEIGIAYDRGSTGQYFYTMVLATPRN